MMKQVLLFLMVFCAVNVRGQIITTFAGTGRNVYSGDGGPATSAGIPSACGGTFDRFGNFYFADELGVNRIRKISQTGIITCIAGGGGINGDGIPATNAILDQPWAIKFDKKGNFYIADLHHWKVRKVDSSSGIISTFVGNGLSGYNGENLPATQAKLFGPVDICFDKQGNLYIADEFNYRIRKIDTLGYITTYAGNGISGSAGDGGLATNAQLGLPEGVIADDSGNIFIADQLSNKVRKVAVNGIITTIAGNGTGTFIGDGLPATDAQFSPFKIAIDTNNRIYIADRYNERIYMVDRLGIFHSICGTGVIGFNGDGGPATLAQISTPNGITFDLCENLYITEAGSSTVIDSGHNIRKVSLNPSCRPDALLIESDTIFNDCIIYPNPVLQTINLLSKTCFTQISIENYLCQTLFTQTYTTTKAEIDMSGYPAGVYIVRVRDKDGGQIVRKVVKE